jgi:RNA polymerase sigma factor (sigma-70 family)
MNKLSKEELVKCIKLAKEGDDDSYKKILGHLGKYICFLTKKFFIQGSEDEDLIQECSIKLLNIIKKFDNTKGSFIYFAQSSIRKHIITSINREQAKKRSVLNNSFSLDDETKSKDGENIVFIDTIADSPNFYTKLIEKDSEEFLIDEISKVLSSMEQKVFVLRFIEGYSYKEIAEKLDIFKINKKTGRKIYDQKSVDNAIWRSRPKIKKVLEKLKINPKYFDEEEEKTNKKQNKTKKIKKKIPQKSIPKKIVKKVVAPEPRKRRGRPPKK